MSGTGGSPDSMKIELLEGQVKVAQGVVVESGDTQFTNLDADSVVELEDGMLDLISGKGSVAGPATVWVAQGDDKIEVIVPQGQTCVLNATTPAVEGVKKGGSVTIDGLEYISGTDEGATFTIAKKGSAVLSGEGDSIIIPGDVATDTVITVGGDSSQLVTTVPGTDVKKVQITKTSGGAEVEVGGAGDGFNVGEKTYTAASDGSKFSVVTGGAVSIISGFASLSDGESITGRNGVSVENPTNSGNDSIVVAADGSSGKDIVTIPKTGGEVKIGSGTYEAASDDTQVAIGTDKKVSVIEGSLALGSDQEVEVGDGSTIVKRTGDQTVTVEASDDGTCEVAISKGGSAQIGGHSIGSTGGDVKVTVGDDGSLEVSVQLGSVTIDGKTYTSDGALGVEVEIDPTGKISAEKVGETISDDRLTEDFNYVLGPGESVAIGDYIYTAPSGCNQGDIVIRGLGAGENPAIVLKEAGKSVDVRRTDGTGGTATYAAESSGTRFSMSEDDSDSTHIDLLEGSVGSDKGRTISIGDVEILNSGTGDVSIVAKDGNTGRVKIPAGGQATIGGKAIGSKENAVTVDIGADGKLSVNIGAGGIAYIGETTYTNDGDTGVRLSIDPESGNVTRTPTSKLIVDTGTGSGGNISEDVLPGDKINLPDKGEGESEIKKDDAILVGWETTDSAGKKTNYGLGSDYIVESGVKKIDAVWVENPKVLVYTAENGGSVTGKTYEVLDGSAVSLKDSDVSREGYTFVGWVPRTDSSIAFAPGISMTASETTYMDAYFIKDDAYMCRLDYDSGEGSGRIASQLVEPGKYVWLPTALDMSRPGYTFVGWASDKASSDATTTGADYSGTLIRSAYYLVTEDETIHAVWESGSSFIPVPKDDDPDAIEVHTSGNTGGAVDYVPVAIAAAVAVILLEVFILREHRRN